MLEAKQYIKTVKELSISVADVSRYMSSNGTEVPEFFLDAARDELKKLANQKVNFGYQVFKADLLPNNILSVENTAFNIGEEVSDAITDSEYVAFFVCSVSEELDSLIHGYTPDEITETYIADLVGTIIVEKSLGVLSDYLKADSKLESLKITNTQSPGNCGWDVGEQKKLFGLLPEKYMGISLNESGMMHPVKSISGIIGIGKKVKFKHSECNLCASANCMFRSEPFDGSIMN